jgi:hypothetical protein
MNDALRDTAHRRIIHKKRLKQEKKRIETLKRQTLSVDPTIYLTRARRIRPESSGRYHYCDPGLCKNPLVDELRQLGARRYHQKTVEESREKRRLYQQQRKDRLAILEKTLGENRQRVPLFRHRYQHRLVDQLIQQTRQAVYIYTVLKKHDAKTRCQLYFKQSRMRKLKLRHWFGRWRARQINTIPTLVHPLPGICTFGPTPAFQRSVLYKKEQVPIMWYQGMAWVMETTVLTLWGSKRLGHLQEMVGLDDIRTHHLSQSKEWVVHTTKDAIPLLLSWKTADWKRRTDQHMMSPLKWEGQWPDVPRTSERLHGSVSFFYSPYILFS